MNGKKRLPLGKPVPLLSPQGRRAQRARLLEQRISRLTKLQAATRDERKKAFKLLDKISYDIAEKFLEQTTI